MDENGGIIPNLKKNKTQIESFVGLWLAVTSLQLTIKGVLDSMKLGMPEPHDFYFLLLFYGELMANRVILS